MRRGLRLRVGGLLDRKYFCMKFLDYLLIAFVASAIVAAIVSIVKKAKNGSCCCGCSACKKYTGDKKKKDKCPLCEKQKTSDDKKGKQN